MPPAVEPVAPPMEPAVAPVPEPAAGGLPGSGASFGSGVKGARSMGEGGVSSASAPPAVAPVDPAMTTDPAMAAPMVVVAPQAEAVDPAMMTDTDPAITTDPAMVPVAAAAVTKTSEQENKSDSDHPIRHLRSHLASHHLDLIQRR
eukprot:gnl/TRDRNA2_/TRDRNA2_162562_c0_seq1.p1 gnl/TRDRNA2_/TRDRNA2_162562_c0~~gnl/TRDRNA2_/TRDRNA2_162562_c0_seq1.p1  ORF type:complete len:170 (-),score=33.22 gnl/TRDRNA2_/TRDRNA2_162562_c0_seq1:205-642(-)